MLKMSVLDVKTNKVFEVDPTVNTAYITTSDGVRVKLHPQVVINMVARKRRFDGFTLIGTREMVRV